MPTLLYKATSASSYGPVVTCGQIISGIKGKWAVGITSLAEGLTCLVGVSAFALTKGWPDWTLVVGAVCSVPLSAWSVKKIKTKDLTLAIGVFTVILGGTTLAKVIWS